MTTIVLNTATGAVTEYDWSFQSITPRHAAAASGLYELGGDTDAGDPIDAELRSGTPGGDRVQGVSMVYVALRGDAAGEVIVQGREQEWEYPVTVRDSGVARARPGGGIRESYLGFGFRNTAGADFIIDRIDADVTMHPTRRK